MRGEEGFHELEEDNPQEAGLGVSVGGEKSISCKYFLNQVKKEGFPWIRKQQNGGGSNGRKPSGKREPKPSLILDQGAWC